MDRDQQTAMLDRLISLKQQGRDEPVFDQVLTIPVTKYTDRDLLDQELDTAFSRYPLLVGHASSVRDPGSFIKSDWDRVPYFVVRGKDGKLRGFLNQCRHRGAELVSEKCGTAKFFTCPFHGWSYGLDGSLRGITRKHDFPTVELQDYGLVELPVAEYGGLVWISPTPGNPLDIATFLGPFAEDLVNFDVGSLIQYKKTHVIKNANWKLLIKTYLEGYHVPYLHRTTLQAAFRKGVIAHDEYGPHIRLSAARTNIDDAHTIPASERKLLDYASVYYSMFPNTFFILHPDYVSINIFYPLAPDRTIWTHEMLYRSADFPGSAGQSALQKRFTFTNDAVFDQEDFAVAENVQKSLLNGANTHHTLGLAEGLLAMFQNNIDDRLTAEQRVDTHV